MSRPFAKNSAKSAFAQFKESTYASDYTTVKKNQTIFCKQCVCNPNKKLYSQSNYILMKNSNKLYLNPCDSINKSQLYINLITKIDLSENIPIIKDLQTNSYPIIIDEYVSRPYLKYNIDPSGNLFGNSVCGIDNFKNYIVSNLTIPNT